MPARSFYRDVLGRGIPLQILDMLERSGKLIARDLILDFYTRYGGDRKRCRFGVARCQQKRIGRIIGRCIDIDRSFGTCPCGWCNSSYRHRCASRDYFRAKDAMPGHSTYTVSPLSISMIVLAPASRPPAPLFNIAPSRPRNFTVPVDVLR